MNKVASVILSVLVLICLSCTEKREMTLAQYRNYIEAKGGGFCKTVTAGPLIYTVQYRPPLYIAAAEHKWQFNDSTEMKTRTMALGGIVWFNVRIGTVSGATNPLKSDVSGVAEYNDRLNYWLTQAANHFTLYYGDLELKPQGYVFENSYGLISEDVVVIGFRLPDTTPVRPLRLEYEDQLYNTGIIKAEISMDVLQELDHIQVKI